MLNFYTAEDNHGESLSNVFHFSPLSRCFQLRTLLSWKVDHDLLLRSVLLQSTQTMALFVLQSAEIRHQGCCKYLCRTFSMKVVPLWLESEGIGWMNYLTASKTSYVLKQVHKPWQDQGLNNNHLKVRKCSSFVSFAAQNLLLSLN